MSGNSPCLDAGPNPSDLEYPIGPDAAWFRPRFTFRNTVPQPEGENPEGVNMVPSMDWADIRARVRVALDPIIGVHSGRTLGVTVVISNLQDLGFLSEDDFWGAAADCGGADGSQHGFGCLTDMMTRVHGQALALFAGIPERETLKLFLGVDLRCLRDPDAMLASLRALLAEHDVAPRSVVPEMSERMTYCQSESLVMAESAERQDLERRVSVLRELSGRVSVRDFGGGYAALPMMRVVRPDFVRLDRFFVKGVAADRERKLMLNTLANMIHLMGVQMVAEGVGAVEEYRVIRHAGCDYVQGPLVGGAYEDPTRVPLDQNAVRVLNHADQRRLNNDAALISAETQRVDPIELGTSMSVVFERFRYQKDQNFFPVVDEDGEPVGIIRELDLKEYTYSLYGKELLSNRALGRTLDAFVALCPVADVNTKAEKILEVFSSAEGVECVLIVSDRKYIGFLSATSLLRVINEKNLALARDQNPLSKLPGNNMINEFISECVVDDSSSYILVYLDFDNFKPFNDKYGYRQGDRAITLFAELLRKLLPQGDVFVGHVGGDDFFVGLHEFMKEQALELIQSMVRTFERDVESFYDEETRQRGFIYAKDREGVDRKFPLLSASAAVVELPRGHCAHTPDEISGLIARLKKAAKAAPDKIAYACYAGKEKANIA